MNHLEIPDICYADSGMTVAFILFFPQTKTTEPLIAFPAISCGVYGYPIQKAAELAISTTLKTLPQCKYIKNITFACFSSEMEQTLKQALAQHPAGSMI